METKNPYQSPTTDVSSRNGGGNDQTSPFSPAGRFGRLSFIAWGAILWVVSNVITAAFGGTQMFVPRFDEAGIPVTPDLGVTALVALAAVGLVFAVVSILFSIRRCHDFNASGWWNLLFLIPLVNLIFMFFLWLKPGDDGANGYGPPRFTPGWEKVVGVIGILLGVAVLVITIGSMVTGLIMAASSG